MCAVNCENLRTSTATRWSSRANFDRFEARARSSREVRVIRGCRSLGYSGERHDLMTEIGNTTNAVTGLHTEKSVQIFQTVSCLTARIRHADLQHRWRMLASLQRPVRPDLMGLQAFHSQLPPVWVRPVLGLYLIIVELPVINNGPYATEGCSKHGAP